ncbi:hypothetical protein [Vaccinia virus]|nr:hypothetical protein [Vaccinia virus]
MITLFLTLCYFILIFIIIVPAIAEKMRRERAAYVNYIRLNKNFICVDDKLFSYNFTTSRIMVKVAVDKKNVPIPCSKLNVVNNNKDVDTLYCDKDRDDIPGFARSCYRAYSYLFFTTYMESTNVRSGIKSRKKRPKTTVIDDDDDCMTCFACQSKWVKISDITTVSLDYINTMRGNTLACVACGSSHKLLNDFAR